MKFIKAKDKNGRLVLINVDRIIYVEDVTLTETLPGIMLTFTDDENMIILGTIEELIKSIREME